MCNSCLNETISWSVQLWLRAPGHKQQIELVGNILLQCFANGKSFFFCPWTEIFYTLWYTILIQKWQLLDLPKKILVNVIVDELENRPKAEDPHHLPLASLSSSKSGCRRNKTPVASIFLVSWLNMYFFLLENVTFFTCLVFHFISSFGVRMSAISHTVAKKEHFCCSICYDNDHLGRKLYAGVTCFM